ncbi:MAG: type IVB secretion system protein DotG/IcmE [Gammaproteobacteria bacterium]|nr:type IVB secretion system protein DotG/IcmE [Gammaproteobacteria bacterium]
MSEENKKIKGGFLQSAKARIFITIGVVVVVVAAVGFIWHNHEKTVASQGYAEVSSAPNISSTPGAGSPSNKYVANQNFQNRQEAVKARKKGGSAVPTLTRPNFIGNPDDFGALPKNPLGTLHPVTKTCPIKKVVVMYRPNPANCAVANLRLARQSGVTAEELRCQGCSCPALKLAGYNAGELKNVGYTATELKHCGYSLQQLIAAGFNAKDLRDAGFSAAQLKNAGFTAGQLRAAGFSADQLKKAGFTAAQLKAGGFGNAKNSKAKNCSVSALRKARLAGASATELRKRGCGLAALKAAGFTAGELKAAGFTASQLKAAGFSAADLKAAGFTAAQLRAAGFTAAQLKKAGFTASQLKNAGFSAGQLAAAGFSAKQLKDAGFSAKQLKAAGFSAADLKAAGFTAAQLKKAGYTKGDLLRAGFTPKQAGYQKPKPAVVIHTQPAVAATNQGHAFPSMLANSPEAKLAALEREQQAAMSKEQRQNAIAQLQSAMTTQGLKLLNGWSANQAQKTENAIPDKNAAGGLIGPGGANAKQGGAAGPHGPTIKAGTIMFAVLNTSINSDEQTPILANVVSGPLKGAKLLGRFNRVNKRVLLSFNLMSLPTYSKSVAVNAVAIDPDTARTAISGSVNNHYLLRYGGLFASAFLQGFSNAILQQNTTSNCGPFSCVVSRPKLTATQQVLAGFGTVGQRYSDATSNVFDTPPTIKIPGGTGIGILVMSDLQLPSKLHNLKNNGVQ